MQTLVVDCTPAADHTVRATDTHLTGCTSSGPAPAGTDPAGGWRSQTVRSLVSGLALLDRVRADGFTDQRLEPVGRFGFRVWWREPTG